MIDTPTDSFQNLTRWRSFCVRQSFIDGCASAAVHLEKICATERPFQMSCGCATVTPSASHTARYRDENSAIGKLPGRNFCKCARSKTSWKGR
jgi:hypothetical protein